MGGKRLQKIEDASTIIVGKYYLVPTVYVPRLPRSLRTVPVIGPPHEDAEFINFPHRHLHPDRRFVSSSWMNYYRARGGLEAKEGHWSVVYSFKVNELDTGIREGDRMRMQCKRLVGSFRLDAPWLTKLENAYRLEKLRDGHICPHRGISCRGVIAENGGVVCPGHGLKWNLETGSLVPRVRQQLPMRLRLRSRQQF